MSAPSNAAATGSEESDQDKILEELLESRRELEEGIRKCVWKIKKFKKECPETLEKEQVMQRIKFLEAERDVLWQRRGETYDPKSHPDTLEEVLNWIQKAYDYDSCLTIQLIRKVRRTPEYARLMELRPQLLRVRADLLEKYHWDSREVYEENF
jgi:hypothetical protein